MYVEKNTNTLYKEKFTGSLSKIVMKFDAELDARGLTCPMPLLKLKQSLNQMKAGEVIQVRTTDPGSVRDFAAYLNQVTSELVEQQAKPDEYLFVIKK